MNNLQFRSGHCSTILANPVLNLTPAWRIQLAGPPLRLARPSQSLLPQLHLVRDESHHSSFPASRTMPCRRTPALPRVRATSVPLSSTQQVYQFCGRKRQGPRYLARVRHTPMRCWTGGCNSIPNCLWQLRSDPPATVNPRRSRRYLTVCAQASPPTGMKSLGCFFP